jgi:membrane-associated phospholipid phosphatase
MATVRAAVLSRYVREPVVIAAAYLFYYLVRSQAAERTADAFKNAGELIRLERDLGMFRELSLQAAALPYAGLTHLFNVIYFYGHFPLILVVGVWLFWKHPPLYSLIRNSFLASGAIALVVFVLFPVAPPRLIGAGFIDTLQYTLALTYDKSPGVNEFAAVPSMHVGWNLLLALGLFLAFRHRLLRALALLLPPAMILSTVVTGNHYLLDAPLGIIVALFGLLIALLIRRYWPQIEGRLPAWLRDLDRRPPEGEAATPSQA